MRKKERTGPFEIREKTGLTVVKILWTSRGFFVDKNVEKMWISG